MMASKNQRTLQATVPGLYLDFLPPGLADRARDFFTYAADWLPLATGTTRTENIAIADDSDFLIVGAVLTARTDATPPVVVPQPALLVQIEDSASNRNLQNRALDAENIYGTARLPGYFPYPKLIGAGSVIATTLTNNQGADLQVRVAYQGFKIFSWQRGV